MKVEDCMAVSRGIEHNLDREEEDFSLEVLSAGVSEPLTEWRQYKKNVGRGIELKLENGDKREGTLIAVAEETLTIEEKVRVEGKKKKRAVQNEIVIAEITKAVIKFSFKK